MCVHVHGHVCVCAGACVYTHIRVYVCVHMYMRAGRPEVECRHFLPSLSTYVLK